MPSPSSRPCLPLHLPPLLPLTAASWSPKWVLIQATTTTMTMPFPPAKCPSSSTTQRTHPPSSLYRTIYPTSPPSAPPPPAKSTFTREPPAKTPPRWAITSTARPTRPTLPAPPAPPSTLPRTTSTEWKPFETTSDAPWSSTTKVEIPSPVAFCAIRPPSPLPSTTWRPRRRILKSTWRY